MSSVFSTPVSPVTPKGIPSQTASLHVPTCRLESFRKWVQGLLRMTRSADLASWLLSGPEPDQNSCCCPLPASCLHFLCSSGTASVSLAPLARASLASSHFSQPYSSLCTHPIPRLKPNWLILELHGCGKKNPDYVTSIVIGT